MANDLNSVIIIGNLVRDCGANERDFAYTQGGMAIATISIASNRSRKQSDGSYANEVSYFDVHLFGKTAENLKPYLLKGQKVAVEGVLKQERWQDKQTGNNMSKIVINANSVQLLGGKRDDNEGFNPNVPYQNARQSSVNSQQNQYQQNQYQQNQNQSQNQSGYDYGYSDGGFQEDIPF